MKGAEFAFLRAVREYQRVDQREVSTQTGISKDQISRWERGKSINPQWDNIQVWAERLNVPFYLVAALAEASGVDDRAAEELALKLVAGMTPDELMRLLRERYGLR